MPTPSTLIAAGTGDFAAITSNQIAGNQGANSGLLALASTSVSFPSDANFATSAANNQNPFIVVTSAVSLTMTRNLILPLIEGAILVITNSTSGGQAIFCVGASGAGALIPNGARKAIICDGTNWGFLSDEIGAVAPKQADYSVLQEDCGITFTNDLASGTVIFTLPTSPTIGTWYEFIVVAAFTLEIKAPGGATVFDPSGSSTSGGTASASAQGAYAKVKLVNATDWFFQSSGGTWTLA